MARRTQWRDCQAWRQEGLQMSTPSNEAVKLFDASLTQLVGWYDDQSLGGLEKTIENMLAADANFVMGHVFAKTTKLMGGAFKSADEDPAMRHQVDLLSTLADKPETNHREKHYINAAMMLLDNRWEDALSIWEDILLDYPTDLLALRFCETGYIRVCNQVRLRDNVYKVLPYWKPSIPLYSHLFGMTAFGEMETGLYDKAERNARKGLDLNPLDMWATHGLAHTLDHTGRYDQGIRDLTSTVHDWGACSTLACHTHWHLALYYIEKGDFDAALNYYDSEIQKFGKNSFHGLDRASLLFRFDMEGVDVGGRWSEVYDLLRPHLDYHTDGFVHLHGTMACMATDRRRQAEAALESTREFIKRAPKHNHYRRIAEKIGVTLHEAIMAWGDEDYARVTQLLLPVRYEIFAIGRSNAQRDVFSQLLIHSALRSPDKRHHKIARSLIYERKGDKDTPLTERLAVRTMDD